MFHLEPPLEVSQVLLFVSSPLDLVPDFDVALWGIYVLLVHALVMVIFPPDAAFHYACWLIFSLLF